ncbi:DDB1- and CUL4-associated factor 10-like [Montipora foliosa]|uniref:DDB1- and CUL4-associated factor 10-like n=1 Tax=Montipora foliosa TaxID=591990 RepID=UPI0035F1EF61
MGESKPETSSGDKVSLARAKPWTSLSYLRHREIQGMVGVTRNDSVISKYYKHLSLRKIWGPDDKTDSYDHGAIFNVEFSPTGDFLVAACERHSLLVFDPLCQKQVTCVRRAHQDCVNCVRFLDSRSFVTCSDDTTVALWDCRNLKSKVLSLEGHTNWVKSIEYHRPSGLIVTSAFDDTVRTWDINRYANDGTAHGRVVLQFSNLIRMKICPDGQKMIISAVPGHLLVIHNLNLDYLQYDIEGDEYPFFGAMDSSLVSFASHRWPSKARNALEIIQDFPDECCPWCISSIEVHPHGWCTVARYTCRNSRNEWTVLHDIQDISEITPGEAPSCFPRRLTHSIQEPNVAKGYIKEHCFSMDGRIICSPFGNSARILSFNSQCDELSSCIHGVPSELYDLKTLITHKHAVVTCRFSPKHLLLSLGCLGGRVSFFQPKL